MNTLSKQKTIQLTNANADVQTFTITLKNGLINEQKLQVLLEFLLICRPVDALKILHNMGINYIGSEVNQRQKEALRELLGLFTGLWEAELNQHEPMDLTVFE